MARPCGGDCGFPCWLGLCFHHNKLDHDASHLQVPCVQVALQVPHDHRDVWSLLYSRHRAAAVTKSTEEKDEREEERRGEKRRQIHRKDSLTSTQIHSAHTHTHAQIHTHIHTHTHTHTHTLSLALSVWFLGCAPSQDGCGPRRKDQRFELS